MNIKKYIKDSSFYKKYEYKSSLWKSSLEFFFLFRILSKFPSHTIRLGLLRLLGAKLHRTAGIHSGCLYWKPSGLKIGAGSVVGFSVNLDARMGLEIGENVTIASEVMIWTLHHDYNDIGFKTMGDKVVIHNYAWLCSRCIILPGVNIGEGAVIASGAVVTKDVEPYTVVGGIPAKKISERSNNLNYTPSNFKLHIM